MAYCEPLDYQYQSGWHANEKQERFPRPDLTPSIIPLDRFTFFEPADELMGRYLQEPDRTLFKPNFHQPMEPYPETPFFPARYLETDGSFYSCRYPSPTHSGRSSLSGSDTSDNEQMPWSQSASASYNVDFMGSHTYYNSPCVALHDVQTYADAQPEKLSCHDDEPLPYGTMIQEGYQPMSTLSWHETQTFSHDSPDHIMDVPSNPLPMIPRRRSSAHRQTLSVQCPTARVSKRAPPSKRSSISNAKSSRESRCTSRAFPCPFAQYGCQSTFGSKNEWKRHTSTQHMRFGFWRCDQCPNSEQKPNDFNRKDLFVQHVRRMHLERSSTTDTNTKSRRFSSASPRREKTDDEYLNRIAGRCYRHLRSPPSQSGCPFCPNVFNDWDERMEHVGHHLEVSRKQDSPARSVKKEDSSGVDIKDKICDQDTEKWLLRENLLKRVGRKLVLADVKRQE